MKTLHRWEESGGSRFRVLQWVGFREVMTHVANFKLTMLSHWQVVTVPVAGLST